MNPYQRVLRVGTYVGIGILFGASGASADPNQGAGDYEFVPCDQFDANDQCSPFATLGSGSSLRQDDWTGAVTYDVVQPVTGEAIIDVSGTNASMLYSLVEIAFTVTIPSFGFVDTNITGLIENATGTVVGDQIQWSGTQLFVADGTIDCQLGFGLCGAVGYADGINVLVDGANVTVGETPPFPTTITLPPFVFSGDGSSLLNTGEFAIDKDNTPPEPLHTQFVALEATYLPEPSATLMLVPGVLLLVALNRRRAHAAPARIAGSGLASRPRRR